jgi:hypothetical protein
MYVLRTRPVSSTFAPTAEPAIRDSRMEETSDAATRDVGVVAEHGYSERAEKTKENDGRAVSNCAMHAIIP